MGLSQLALLALLLPFVVLGFYLTHLNFAIKSSPEEALALSPHRWTDAEIQEKEKETAKKSLDTLAHLPSATGRRYVVVGGTGFIGGWVVLHLLARGENPRHLRIISRRPPTRRDLASGDAAKVEYVFGDVCDLESIRAAFARPWHKDVGVQGITVFYNVAEMRFYERSHSLLSRSLPINVDGTANTLKAAKEAGADLFIFSSSASISIRRNSWCVWPWQKRIPNNVQIYNDESRVTKTDISHEEFTSNYAYTKFLAEKLVTEANDPANGFCTGSLRPGNAVFGSGGDANLGSFLIQGLNPTFTEKFVQSFTYVENMTYAVLLYEARLLDHNPTAPDLSGRSYLIADKGDPPTYSDVYRAMSSLTKGAVRFPIVPASVLLVLAIFIEQYYILQTKFPRFLPELSGKLAKLQPPIFDLVAVHLKIDDSRARLPPSEGGIGYRPPWTTLDGICQLVKDHTAAINAEKYHDTAPQTLNN